MLHVTLNELAGSGPQQLLPSQLRPRDQQRHAVLELVAKAVGAAGLIKCRSRPHAADQRLIEHPAIQDDVEAAARCLDLNRAERSVPPALDLVQYRSKIRGAVARD